MGTENWKMGMSRDELFWMKVRQGGPSECWEWTASKNKDGYGQFWIGHTFIPAHRYAWASQHGDIPEGMFICHHCDNPSCCNPDHLFLGNAQINNLDAIQKGRQKYNGRPIFTPEQVLLIRLAYSSGKLSEADIAEVFGVNQSTIHRLLKNNMYGGIKWESGREE